MNNWPYQMKLFAVLSTIKVLLETSSQEDGWGFESPQKSLDVINHTIAFFLKPQENKLPADISIQFAPTGPLQEISISNGWDEVFLKLAEEFDKYEYCLKDKKSSNKAV